MNTFDEASHTYTITGRKVPSVTQIITAVFGPPRNAASDWHLERGRAVHACCAMIARGIEFDHDPAIDGQVRACRKFFRELNPWVSIVERQGYDETRMYAGTCDAVVLLNDARIVIDWKSSLSATEGIQLGGYGQLFNVSKGMSVVLGDDGQYHCSKVYDLKRWVSRFNACLTVNGIKEELGI